MHKRKTPNNNDRSLAVACRAMLAPLTILMFNSFSWGPGVRVIASFNLCTIILIASSHYFDLFSFFLLSKIQRNLIVSISITDKLYLPFTYFIGVAITQSGITQSVVII